MIIDLKNINLSEFIVFATAERMRDSVTSEDRERFSAKINAVPRAFIDTLPTAAGTALYRDYLQFKYAFFTYCIDPTKYLNWNIPDLNNLKELTDHWDNTIQTNEACVYLLRRNQFGEEAIGEWYSQEINEFVTWTELITTRNYLSDHIYSEDIGNQKFTLNELDWVLSIENEVSKKFIELMESNKQDESEYLLAFLNILQENSGAKICDYLNIDFAHNEVDFKLASLKLSDEERNLLAQEESYHERIGITGSILVPCTRNHFHVGTNNLQKDPRQSQKQNNDYAKIYKLHDGAKSFWVFPIRDFNNTIVAAFRVVDKKDGSVWSYSERFSLLAIAEWFSCFWSYTHNFLQTHNIDDVRKVTYKCCNEGCTQCLGGINKEILRKILEHLKSVAHRKVESHSIGASILIIPNKETIESLYIRFPKYPISFDLSTNDMDNILEYISLAYKGINPKATMFVYDKGLKYIGVYLIRDESVNFEQGVKHIGANITESVLFTLIGGTYSIRMYCTGKMVADYYHSEVDGVWRFRCIKEINALCKQIYDESFIRAELFNKILEIALELSFDKKGAMIVICNDSDLDTKLKDGKRAIGNFEKSNIYNLTNNNIQDYATMDGAIILTTDGTIREIGTILPVDEIISDGIHNDKYEQWCKWKTRLSKKQKGSRHTTAIKFSIQHPDACIFVISENRGISIFYKGHALLWDDENFTNLNVRL
jgi:DNA integrity scanning protein DisA with diadenylate cyclase activity